MKLLKPLLTLTLLFFFVSFNLVAGEHIGIGTHLENILELELILEFNMMLVLLKHFPMKLLNLR